MRFEEILLEMLLEGKIEDTLDRHPTIPEHIKQDYLRQVPANNAQHLDWVLQQHTKGNITPEHNINEILTNFNKVKDKLSKKQIHQYKSVDELHSAILPHIDSIQKTKREKQEEGTETIYSSPTMTIRQHHNYESCVKAGFLPKNNNSGLDKATWCISVGDGGGAAHYGSYTDNGFHPVYSIEHHHPDGTSSKHMFVYDYNKPQYNQELRNEDDYRPGFSNMTSTRNDLLDHYGSEHPEILKTPIAKFFTKEGRKEYTDTTKITHENYKQLLLSVPKNGMSDEEYMHFFNEGQKKQQGGLHNQLAKVTLSDEQLNHLVNYSNENAYHQISERSDLTNNHLTKLSNTSNMLTHNNLLYYRKLPVAAFNNIVKNGHAEIAHKIIEHPGFNKTHIDTIINKGLTSDALTELTKKHFKDLDSPRIHKIIDTSNVDTLTQIPHAFDSKLEASHISKLIDKGDSMTIHNLINHLSDKLDETHIDKIIKNNTDKLVFNTLFNNSHILSDNQLKTILPHISEHSINFNYSDLSPNHQKVIINHVQNLKDNNNERWKEFTYVHPHLNMSNIEKTKVYLETSQGVHQIENNLSEKELQDHIHPIIDNIIDNAHTYDLPRHLVNFAGLTNKEQTNKILDRIHNSNDISINFATNSNLPNHVRDAIIDKAIKDRNTNLVHRTLVLGKNITNIQPHHLEYIKQHLPIQMPNIDKEGVHAKEVIQNAFENPNREFILLNDIPKSTNKKYKSEYLDHIIKNGNDSKINRYLTYNSDVSHEDLDKILEYSKKHDYLHEGSNLILPKIADIRNLSSNHISHIIASGHLGAIKKMIDSQSKSNFTKQHLDDMIDIKDKEISNKLAEYPILGKEQEEKNNKVLQESKILFKNNFEKILLETIRISNE